MSLIDRSLIILFAVCCAGIANAQLPPAPRYPATPRGTQVDDAAGIRISDPYRWLEGVATPEVHAWSLAQSAVTEAYLAQLPRRAEITGRLRRSADYARLSTPFGGGDRLFFLENAGLENQSAVYVQDRHDLPPRVLIDLATLSADGLVAVVGYSASPDGRYLAYATSARGSAWLHVAVRDVRTSQDLGDDLRGIRDARIAWTKDARGFFYVRVDTARSPMPGTMGRDGNQRLFYHRVGQPQSDDQLMFESPDHPEWLIHADLSEDGQYLVIALHPGVEARNRLYFIDLDNPKRPNLNAPLVKLFDTADALYEFVASEGPIFFVRTTRNAPRARLVAVDINAPDMNHWTPVIRETYDPLLGVHRIDDRFVAHRLHDAHSVLELYSLDGGVRGGINIPGVGTVSDIRPRAGTREIYFTFSSFVDSPRVLRFDLDTRMVVSFRDVSRDTSLAGFETTQLYYTSRDGTRVPMFVTARRGLTLNGTVPTLLEVDGAFGRSSTPRFSPLVSTWLQHGGIHVVANVRGGGEYGRAWHDAATGARKQTSVDDLIAAAEFLISQRYTRSTALGIMGTGDGGLVAAAALVQRPDLFGAASISQGLLDMARFDRYSAGPTWTAEYGSPDNAADMRALLAVSPLQGIRPGLRVRATLITVGEADDLIPAFHSYKFAAALQAAASADAGPVLLRVEPGLALGSSAPLLKQLATDADRLVFLINALRDR